jgi:hypothetical protein
MSDQAIQLQRRSGTFAGVFTPCVLMPVGVTFGMGPVDSARDVRLGD